MNTDVHFSSATDDWATPQAFFDKLDKEFHFTLDVCASPSNAKCEVFFVKEDNALLLDWTLYNGAAWMNPPYGRGIGKWVAKAAFEAMKGLTVVCLIPARTDTRWWHGFIWNEAKNAPREGVEVRFVKGRLKFGNATASAPFPSAVVIFRGQL